MPISVINGGQSITHWGVSHKDGKGNLISRQAIAQAPDMKPCLALKCVGGYFKAQMIYVLTLLYHQYRVEYAEKMRGKEIKMDYRTGENAPSTIPGLVWAIMRLPHA